MLAVAIICGLLGLLVDFCNPAMKGIEIAAGWLYMPAAIAFVDVLDIQEMADKVHSPMLRFMLWCACLAITAALASSLALRPIPVIRKIIVPVSDSMLGLGNVGHKDVNQAMIGFIFAAAILSCFSAGEAAKTVKAFHAPVVAVGDIVSTEIGIKFIGYGK